MSIWHCATCGKFYGNIHRCPACGEPTQIITNIEQLSQDSKRTPTEDSACCSPTSAAQSDGNAESLLSSDTSTSPRTSRRAPQ